MPAFPCAFLPRWAEYVDGRLLRHVAGLRLDRIVDAVVRGRAQLRHFDEAIAHSLMAGIAVLYDCGVCRIESLEILRLYRFVDRREGVVIEIGRASCRERVLVSVVGVSLR